MFHNSPYTTPTKKDSSALAQNKVKLEILMKRVMPVHLHAMYVPILQVLLNRKNMYLVENLRWRKANYFCWAYEKLEFFK